MHRLTFACWLVPASFALEPDERPSGVLAPVRPLWPGLGKRPVRSQSGQSVPSERARKQREPRAPFRGAAGGAAGSGFPPGPLTSIAIGGESLSFLLARGSARAAAMAPVAADAFFGGTLAVAPLAAHFRRWVRGHVRDIPVLLWYSSTTSVVFV